jgi:carboxylate-amine ligase
MDIQECPKVDLAIVTFVIELLKALFKGQIAPIEDLQRMPTENLAAMLDKTILEGQKATFDDPKFLSLFSQLKSVTARQLLQDLFEKLIYENNLYLKPFEKEVAAILQHGTLSDRILRSVGATPDSNKIRSVYHQLAECLAKNQLFVP